MSLFPRQKWAVAVSILLIFALAGLLVFIHYVPVYIETRLLPHWAARSGFDLRALRIRHIGLWGADVGPVALKLGDRPFLEVDAVKIDYSPLAVLKKEIRSVVFSGVALTVTLNEQGTAIQGLPPKASASTPSAAGFTLSEFEKWLSFCPEHVAMRHAVFTVHWRGHNLQFPLTLAVDTHATVQGRHDLKGFVDARGNRLDFSLAVTPKNNDLDLGVTGQGLRAESFADLLALLGPVTAAGALDLRTRAQCALQPFAVQAATVNALVSHTRIGVPGMALVNAHSGDAQPAPMAIELASVDGGEWHWSASPCMLEGPVRVDVLQLTGRITQAVAGEWTATARLETQLPVQTLNKESDPPWRLDRPLSLSWDATAQLGGTGGDALQLALRTRSGASDTQNIVQLRQGADASLFFTPHAEFTGRIQGGLTGRFNISAAALDGRKGGLRVGCPRISLTGEVLSDPVFGIEARADLPDVKVSFDHGVAHLPRNRVDVHLQQSPASEWSLTGTLDLTKGRLVQQARHLEMRDLSLHLPLQWPAEPSAPEGELAVAQMVWASKSLGGLKGPIGLKGKSVWARLRHQSKLFPGLIVHMNSEAGAWGAKATVDIPAYKTAATIDLGRIVPAADGYSAAGRLSARAVFETGGETPHAEARINIDQGVVRHARSRLVVEGIACDLHMADLMALRSAPRQKLKVEALTMGNLSARKLQMDFQLEPESTLFIERAGLQWCRGRVQAQAFRIKPDLKDLDVTLFCDRLNLAMLLGQIGVAQGSGDGEVNGRIPIGWHKGVLSFDSGFLYSTPGQIGTIQLQGTEMYLASLPPGSPQRIQLEIATEAMRNYIYNWAKMRIDSNKEMLLVNLQLDGRPNRLMPFVLNPETGSLERAEGEEGQADFKGIGIDMNFNIPLSRILEYKELAGPK